MRLARAATGRPNMVVFQGGYHGRSIGTLSLTRSKAGYGVANHPQMPGVFVAPFPYASQAPGMDSDAALYQLELLLKQQSAYATQGSNPRLAGSRQVCYSHVRALPWTDHPTPRPSSWSLCWARAATSPHL